LFDPGPGERGAAGTIPHENMNTASRLEKKDRVYGVPGENLKYMSDVHEDTRRDTARKQGKK